MIPAVAGEGDVMRIARRNFLQLAIGAAALPAASSFAIADTYPSRPIRLVLPFPPGGAFDIIGRPWADKVKASLGTVVVDNQPGAGGSLAAQIVAHAMPDGYTVFLGASSIHLTEMILREHPLLDPMRELVPVAMIALTCFAITVHPSVPVHSLMELIDYIKANPGKVSYGSAGAGTMNHLSGELLKSLTGIKDLPHVPYRGSGPGMADLVGGQIPVYIAAMTSQVLEFHRAGKLRMLAITNDKRLPVCPDIPTAAESGVPELVTTQVIGIFTPAGTPVPIIAQLAAANTAALADKSYQQALIDTAFTPLIGWTPEKFNQYMANDVARWSPLVKSIGIRLE
jgi:tripartite-type tricarboxylate transporter receptor subunit TctC